MREDVKALWPRRLATALGAMSAIVLVGAGPGGAPARAATSVTFTDNGSFTVPDGVTQLTVTAVGGGGGGGGDSARHSAAAWGGGGGGAGTIVTCVLPVTAGQVFTVTVGGGGGNGSSQTAADNPGPGQGHGLASPGGGRGGGMPGADGQGDASRGHDGTP
ncbi:MAG: hypothetical protein HOV87_16495, partial [Catenulispora sp.]|nr:hypothetical protein [Catenulispora sp.]